MGQYNRLGQRRAGGAWQWLVIGFFPGLLCGGLIIFLLLFTGVFNAFSPEPETIEVTSPPIYIAVTATSDPDATQVVQVITATPAPTEEAEAGSVIIPSSTPFSTPVIVEPVTDDTAEVTNTPAVLGATNPQDTTQAETDTTDTTDTTEEDSSVVNPSTSVNSSVPADLASIASNLIQIEGGEFAYGTDNIEIVQAVQACIARDGGQCQESFATDSTPQVQVALDTFWLEQNEVTFAQYEVFLNYLNSQGLRHLDGCQGFVCIQTQNERPAAAVYTFDGANYRIPANYEALRNHPAYGVTWYGAQTYCQVLGRRLPTEAEWEYAARAGGQTISYPWGNDWIPTNANVRQPLIDTSANATVAITDFVAGTNALGLTHMSGNVAEWVLDPYLDSYHQVLSAQQVSLGGAVPNPQGPATGTQRVLRGGSFNALPFFARTYHRQSFFPAPEIANETDYPLWVGFRCASDTGGDTAGASTTTTGTTNSADDLLQTPIPAVGDEDNNAQPVAPEDTDTESNTGDGTRG